MRIPARFFNCKACQKLHIWDALNPKRKCTCGHVNGFPT
jgi:hypothetical protein